MHDIKRIAHRNICEDNIVVIDGKLGKLINLEMAIKQEEEMPLPEDYVKYLPKKIERPKCPFCLDMFQFACVLINYYGTKKISKSSDEKELIDAVEQLPKGLRKFVEKLLIGWPVGYARDTIFVNE